MRAFALLAALLNAAIAAAEADTTLPGFNYGEQTDTIVLERVELDGTTVMTDAQISEAAAAYIGRSVTIDDLRDLQQALTLLYVTDGYVNSGVLLPDQPVRSGVVRFRAIEGSLSEVRFTGFEPARRSRVHRQLHQLPTPFRLTDLQERMQDIERRPYISHINGRVRPGDTLGDAVLDLDIVRTSPYEISLQIDNHQAPSIGAERAVVRFEHFDLTGSDDRLRLTAVSSEGRTNGGFSYELPVGLKGLVSASYSTGGSEVIDSGLNALDIENDAEFWSLGYTHQLTRSTSLFASFSRTSSETELLGVPFSFALGAEDGESVTASVEAGAQWVRRWPQSVVAARIAVRRGLDLLDATIRDRASDRRTGAEIPDGRYTAGVLQLQYARNVPLFSSQVVISGTWQHAFDPLLSVQKMALGGARSVRGYRENQLVRDGGVVASAEWRIPIGVGDQGIDRLGLTVVPFVDYGRASDHDGDSPGGGSVSITSAGLGVEWRPWPALSVNAYWGQAFDDDEFDDPQDYDLQDDGWHFAVRLSYPFSSFR